MLQSVLILHTRPGGVDDLIAEYRRAGVIEAAVPFGLLRGEALTSVDDPDRLIVTSLWRDAAAYDGWLASAERVRVTRVVNTLVDPHAEQEILKLPRDGSTDPEVDLPLDGVEEGAVERVILVVP